MGVGAAMTGLRPIVEGMNMGFLLLAFSQISNNAGMLHYTSGGNFKVPMVVRGPGGACAAPRRAAGTAAPDRMRVMRAHVACAPAQAWAASWARSTRSALSRTSRLSLVRGASRLRQRAQAADAPHARTRRPAGRVQYARQRQGAAEVCDPQRQPHRVLRGTSL
jgi:hypothetical protein